MDLKDDKDIERTEHIESSAAISHLDPKATSKLHRHGATQVVDEATRILEEAGGHVDYTATEKKQLLRRIDLYVCVPMCLTYFIQQMDKSALGWAAIFDLQAETHLVGSQYSWLSSVGYFAQLVFQPLSSYALIVFPVKYWLMFNMISWGIVTICTAAATNFHGFLVCRILLGAFEATVLPSFIFITQMWYTRREQSYRTIAYQIANSAAAIIGPLISYGIGHVGETGGKLRAYQGIYLFMGAFTLFIAPIVWYLMPNSPTTAKFLRRGNDRLIALERLRENNTGTKVSKFNWAQFWETYRDPKTYMWILMFFCVACPSGGIGSFGGLITKGFGFSSFVSVLMQMPTGAIGIIVIMTNIFVQNHYKKRFVFIAATTVPAIAGAAALVKVDRHSPGGLIAAYYVCYCFSALQPLLYAWANLNAGGTTKRVVTTASLFVAQCVGNIVGPQVYLARQAPVYKTGLIVDLCCWGILCLLVLTMGWYLTWLNKKQAARRLALGLPSELKDMSIMTLEEAEAYKLELTERLRISGFDEAKLYEKSFDDLTDFENPLFMYVI
ncbi:major facilitator superfamily domain-containing protein [Naematelia encephala]|uniref:Major facilitator superfamily domain-containing protein n=1 Tax=Naematelia encephala TaxID=71784 RepID=A0A1Y2ARZ0_9TREE|nr:major facilitator superfamily domain-containing protein [Naematelia encephala]